MPALTKWTLLGDRNMCPDTEMGVRKVVKLDGTGLRFWF